MEQVRNNIDLLSVQSRHYQDLKQIFDDYLVCEKMLNENPDDKEVREMVLEEVEELNEKAEKMKDALFESLLTPEKYEDCKEA